MNETERAELHDAIERTAGDVFLDTDGMTTASTMASNIMRAVVPVIDRLLAAATAPKQLSVEYACGSQEYWDLEPDGSLRIDIPHDRVVVSSTDLDDAPGMDMGKIRLEAQVRYLKSRLISAEMRVEGVKGRGPEVVARIERIIGGIEGNMEVAAVEAERDVAQATGTQEGAER